MRGAAFALVLFALPACDALLEFDDTYEPDDDEQVFECPGALPSDHQCLVTASGPQSPAWYGARAIQGTWVDSSAGFCATWRSDGTARFTYRNGGADTGRWGVLVNETGATAPSNDIWYVATVGVDPQLTLFAYEVGSSSFSPYNLRRGSCPY